MIFYWCITDGACVADTNVAVGINIQGLMHKNKMCYNLKCFSFKLNKQLYVFTIKMNNSKKIILFVNIFSFYSFKQLRPKWPKMAFGPGPWAWSIDLRISVKLWVWNYVSEKGPHQRKPYNLKFEEHLYKKAGGLKSWFFQLYQIFKKN